MRGITRKDTVENDTLTKELEVEKVSEKMREKRLKWYAHVWRSEDQGLCKRGKTSNEIKRKAKTTIYGLYRRRP